MYNLLTWMPAALGSVHHSIYDIDSYVREFPDSNIREDHEEIVELNVQGSRCFGVKVKSPLESLGFLVPTGAMTNSGYMCGANIKTDKESDTQVLQSHSSDYAVRQPSAKGNKAK